MNQGSPIKSHKYVIEQEGKNIEVALSLFSNSLMVVVSQLQRFGSIIQGECENWQESNSKEEYIYEIQTLFGSKEFEVYELIARGILESMYDREKFIRNVAKQFEARINPSQIGNPFMGKTLQLFIALESSTIRDEGQQFKVYKLITESISDNLVNLFG